MARKTHEGSHQYQRRNIAGKGRTPYYVFQCIITGCPHYKHTTAIVGSTTRCNYCGEDTTIQDKNTAKPMCQQCKDPVSDRDVLDVLERLLDDEE